MTAMKEHDRVVLTVDVPGEKLTAGDVGTVVHVYDEGRAYEVEFVSLDGETIAVVTVERSQVRSVERRQMKVPSGARAEATNRVSDGSSEL